MPAAQATSVDEGANRGHGDHHQDQRAGAFEPRGTAEEEPPDEDGEDTDACRDQAVFRCNRQRSRDEEAGDDNRGGDGARPESEGTLHGGGYE